jgi:hypothetical protein
VISTLPVGLAYTRLSGNTTTLSPMESWLEDSLSRNWLTVDDIAEIVIGLLAAMADKDPAQLRAELAAAGAELPVDSLLIAEILVKVEAACQVRLQVTPALARSTWSVMAFAQAVQDALEGDNDSERSG